MGIREKPRKKMLEIQIEVEERSNVKKKKIKPRKKMLETQRAEAKSQFQSPTCSLAVTVTYGAVEGGVKRTEASGWTKFQAA